jgi:hypothetical protein
VYDEEGNMVVDEDVSDVVMRDRVLRWQAAGQPMLSLVSSSSNVDSTYFDTGILTVITETFSSTIA